MFDIPTDEKSFITRLKERLNAIVGKTIKSVNFLNDETGDVCTPEYIIIDFEDGSKTVLTTATWNNRQDQGIKFHNISSENTFKIAIRFTNRAIMNKGLQNGVYDIPIKINDVKDSVYIFSISQWLHGKNIKWNDIEAWMEI